MMQQNAFFFPTKDEEITRFLGPVHKGHFESYTPRVLNGCVGNYVAVIYHVHGLIFNGNTKP